MQTSLYHLSKPRYEILDGLRGVAALLVVLFHLLETYSGGPATQIINHGYLAVDFFFALSGFVIGYAYDDRRDNMSVLSFFKRRLIRLHPMVVMGTLIGSSLYFFGQCEEFPLSTARNAENQYTLFNIAYAQYFKFDFDFSKSFRFDNRNSMALHFGMGVAYPYGNSTILPYEKRYFSGGANRVRGWSVRGLGPGSFKGNDGRIDFINQTGDVKLDMNIEYRSHLFWKVDAAVFIDAGNNEPMFDG